MLPTRVAPRKLVIKNFSTKPQPPNTQATWNRLKQAVAAIFQQRPVPYSYEQLYKSCESICLYKMAHFLHQNLLQEIETHVRQLATDLASKSHQETFLAYLNQSWLLFCQQLLIIRNIFLYMDRSMLLLNAADSSSAEAQGIWEIGLAYFRTHVIGHPDIKRNSVELLLRTIRMEREGSQVDRLLLKSLLRMFVDLQVYTSFFEHEFLHATEEFYSQESKELLSRLPTFEYLAHCEERIQQEMNRVSLYLDSMTRKPLIHTLEKESIIAHIPEILDKGFQSMINDRKIDDLSRLYRLFSRIDALDPIRIHFSHFLRDSGTKIVMQMDHDNTMVQELLDLKQKSDEVLTQAFGFNIHPTPSQPVTPSTPSFRPSNQQLRRITPHSPRIFPAGMTSRRPNAPIATVDQGVDWSEKFIHAQQEAFEFFLNKRQNKCAELIAKFLDGKMRTGYKEHSEAELEHLLGQVLFLFRFIQGKDVFEAFYKRDFAKRLLLGKSSSEDLERSMISKLKNECGAGFTVKLEGMLKDMGISKDLLVDFKNSKFYDSINGFDLTISVLTQGFWPTYPPANVHIPQEMEQFQKVFTEFYSTKHQGRNLTWQPNLGYCLLKARLPKGDKEFHVSIFQAIVLLCWENIDLNDELDMKQIKSRTNIDDEDLQATLQSLACGKFKLLNKTTKSKDVSPEDRFSVNLDFQAKLHRIKINAIQLKETQEEHRQTEQQVFADRQYAVDAAIVRLMKTRKTMSHSTLVAELFEMCRFPMEQADIKKRIESLLEREFLARDDKDKMLYHYVA